VVEVDGAVASVLALAGDECAGAGLAAHPVAERRRIGEGSRDDVARRDLDTAHLHGLRRVEPELVQRLEDIDELRTEPVLEGHPAAIDLARNEHDLLVLDVDALDHADPLRELEQLGLGERLGRVEAALLLPDQRRVQALLDRRPDREGRSEVVALDDEVGAVAHCHLVDLGEEVVGGVAGEDVGEPGLDPDPRQREQAALPPALVHVELVLPELDVGPRERHRHVEIRAPVLERCVEDRRVEARVGSVEDGVGAGLAQQADERVLVARVDLRRGEAVVAVPLDDGGRPGGVEVGEGHPLEEAAPLRHRGDRRADRPRPDHEYLHQRRRISVTPSRNGSRTASTRSSCRTCSLKRLIACAFSPSPSRPKSVLSAAITPRGESFGRTAS
jgi:hypothetical protein